jgi:NAD(P)-dependent dehydrogenase (short-subunit alcohol dehydrogenase family)
MVEDGTVMARWGHPSEMASILKFLASDDASYMTGSNVVADGGMLVNQPDMFESFQKQKK